MNTNEPIRGPECPFAAYQAEQKHWSPFTLERCEVWLSQLQDYFASRELSWDRASVRDLKEFEVHLQWAAGRTGLYAANTVYQGLRMIRGFYRWSLVRGLVVQDPTRDWILPRPRSAPAKLLSQVELLRLFNVPDLTRWSGQRDALLLGLVFYGGHSLQQCLRLGCDDLQWTGQEEPALKAAFDRYVREARATTADANQKILLLTRTGQPLTDVQALRLRLRLLGQRIGHEPLTVRDLRSTRKALQTELSKRQAPLL